MELGAVEFLSLNIQGSFAMYRYMKILALLFSVFVLLGGSLVLAAKVEVIEVPSVQGRCVVCSREFNLIQTEHDLILNMDLTHFARQLSSSGDE